MGDLLARIYRLEQLVVEYMRRLAAAEAKIAQLGQTAAAVRQAPNQ
jgi:hypothetical protein